MIDTEFQEAFSAEWVKIHVPDTQHELVILRKVIPWKALVQKLSSFYHSEKGRKGISLRIVIAIFILQFLRHLGDRIVKKAIKENRYMQFFCNIPDKDIVTFMDSSTLTKLRNRFGVSGI